MQKNPIICAIDTSDLSQAESLIKGVSPHVGMVKLGLEFFTSHGKDAVRSIVESGASVFLDLKFHDIPNTVNKAVSAATSLGVDMITVHASGGEDMLKAAVEAASGRTKVLAVTVLTSMDENDLEQVGVSKDPKGQVLKLAEVAVGAGVDGLVCSANELEELKKIYNNDVEFVVPGIRPFGSDVGDQKRVMTPEAALEKGADYLVIGRPITGSDDPAVAAEEIFKNISN